LIAAHREGLAAPDSDRREAAVEWTVVCAQLAADPSCPLVHVIPGDDPMGRWAGTVNVGQLGPFTDSLCTVVDRAAALGVQVSLERWSSDVTSADSAKRHRDRHLGRPALRGQGPVVVDCQGCGQEF